LIISLNPPPKPAPAIAPAQAGFDCTHRKKNAPAIVRMGIVQTGQVFIEDVE
jgi:hypothetical protein